MKRIWSEIKAVWLMFIWAVCMAFAMAMQARAADTIYTVRVVFTGVPADGNTLTVNGSVRTFKTVVASASTQVAIGASAELTAAALVTQLANYPFTGISAHRTGTNVTLVGTINQVITASAVGSWGTVTVTSAALTNYTMRIPFAGISSGSRQLVANHLVEGIDTYATSRFSASAAAFANFMTLATEQTISAKKTLAGQTILSNATSMITLGQISNVVARAVKLKQAGTLSGVYLENSGGSSVYTIAPDADGKPTLYTLSGDTLGAGPSYTPTADHILTKALADNLYGRLGTANTWTANNTFATILPTLIDGASGAGKTTNLVVHASTLFADSAMFRGNLAASNTAPFFEWFKSDGTSGTRKWRAAQDVSGIWTLGIYDEANNPLGDHALSIAYNAGVLTATFAGPVEFDAGMTIANGFPIVLDDELLASGAVVTGLLDSSTVPAFIGFYAADGGGLGSDPTSAIAVFSNSGIPKYRASATSEGAGREHYLHNRTETVAGSGSDYSATTSTAAVDFGGTDPTITLPTAGMYLIEAETSILNGGTANDLYKLKLRNTTDGADISNSDVWLSDIDASQRRVVGVRGTVEVSASKVVGLWGHNETAARGTFESARTRIRYIRLH